MQAVGVRKTIEALGLSVTAETRHDLLLYCVYHNNNDTPSLSVSKSSGSFICFNPLCYERGSLLDLVKHVGGFNELEALRFVQKSKPDENSLFLDELSSALENTESFDTFNPNVLKELHSDFAGSEGEAYMHSRGFNDDTLEHFKVGYSDKQRMVTVPVYSHNNIPVGLIGRSVKEKRFKNSRNLPSSKVFFNLNNVIRISPTAIIVESAFDAMRVHQAGFPNVIATIGGHVSKEKFDLLNRYFTKIIIMTDNDETKYYDSCGRCDGKCMGHNPGRQLGKTLDKGFKRNVEWAMYSFKEVYPRNCKDAGDMTDEEIQYVIKNAVSSIEYMLQ